MKFQILPHAEARQSNPSIQVIARVWSFPKPEAICSFFDIPKSAFQELTELTTPKLDKAISSLLYLQADN